MFRYGGPIKEGIMQGMKDGGSLSPQFNTGLVGDERYPKAGGREKHALFLAPAVMPALATLGRFALRPLGKFAMRQFAGPLRQSLTGKGGQRLLTSGKPIKGGFQRNIFEPNVAGRYILGSPEAKFLTGTGGKISKAVSGGIKGTLRSPTATLLTAGTLTDILPGGKPFGPDKYLPNILGQRFDEQGNKIPGTGFFNPDTVAKGETEGMKRVDTIGAGEGSTGGGVTDDPNKKKEIDDARIEKTKKRYYELMGIDKMKKDAAYDSLIDASKIVQEEGADLKGAIKSGALQNRIIQAISKNLDKSADIKRQIDAAILKGEIQKDIASADTTDKEYKKARTKQLKQATSATGQIAAIEAEKGTILGSQTAAILRASDIKYDDIIQDKLFNNFVKDNPGADEIDFMQAKGTGLDDGRYVIRGRLVEKKGNEVAFIVQED